MTAEHTIQNQILLKVCENNCTIFRSNAGKVRTETGRIFVGMPRGFPDLCGFRHKDGKMIFIEVKNETGRLREDQKRFAKMIKNYPVLYGVARSVEDALKIVNQD